MPIKKLVIFIALIISGSFTVNAENTPIVPEGNPKIIPITHSVCCLECSYYLPFCYNYNILNMNDGIKVKNWNFDQGWIKGRAIADIDANLIIKMCYQLSLTSAYIVIDEELDLKAEFEFSVNISRLSPEGNIIGQCIDDGKSSITYSSFVLKGNLTDDPIPLIKVQLIEDIKSIIKHSLYKTAYNSLMGDNSPENQKGENIYCDISQTDQESSTAPCPCY